MLQTVDGKEVYVVDFDTLPELPITWETPEEEPYARCLTAVIEDKVITEPGKYGIEITNNGQGNLYNVYQIKE